MARLSHRWVTCIRTRSTANSRAIEPDYFRTMDMLESQISKSQISSPARPFSATPVSRPSKPRSRRPCWPRANRGLLLFTGAYHGLGYGALNATHRGHFREPFRAQLRQFGHFCAIPPSGNRLPSLSLIEIVRIAVENIGDRTMPAHTEAVETRPPLAASSQKIRRDSR